MQDIEWLKNTIHENTSNNVKSTKGVTLVRSERMKRKAKTSVTRMPPMKAREVTRQTCPSLIKAMKVARAGRSKTAPFQSNSLPSWARLAVGGMASQPITLATSPNGTLIQKAQRQPRVASRKPPITGPTLKPTA